MKKFLRNRLFVVSTIATVCMSFLYIMQKTDVFTPFRLFHHATPVYALWLVALSFLAYASFMETRKIMPFIHAFSWGIFPSLLLIYVASIMWTDTHIHWIFTAFSGFFMIGYGMDKVYGYHKKHHTPSAHKKPLTALQLSLIIPTIILYFIFGISHLDKAFYVDEKLWVYDRIETYWDNMMTGDWYNTRPSDKPGVTTALFSGPGLLFFDPSDYDKEHTHDDQREKMFFALRLPLFLGIFYLIMIAFVHVRTLTNTETAIIFLILLFFSPLLLGMSRIINPDALLWIFFLVSFLCFMRYIFTQSLPALYCTGIFLGFSLLTKYIANIFIVFYFIALLADPIIRKEMYGNIGKIMRDRITHYGIMIFIALSVFYILYPGAWVKHDRILLATIHSEAFASTWLYFACFIALLITDVFWYHAKITSAIIGFFRPYRTWLIRLFLIVFSAFSLIAAYNVYTNMSLFDFMRIIESPKSAYRDVSTFALFSTSFYPLIFGITPLVVIGATYGIYRTLHTKKMDYSHVVIFYSIVFILMYYTGSIVNHVAPIARYQIVLYPLIILIASIGWTFIFSHVQKSFSHIFTIFAVLFIVIESMQLLMLHHFYFSYNSPLLPKKYVINTKDMGDGNYEIAQYLNSLPHAKDSLIWTDKTGVCQFFVGTCNNMLTDKHLIDIAPHFDYYVISQNRKNYIEQLATHRPDFPVRLERLYDASVPAAFEMHPDNRAGLFIRVIESKNIDIINH